MSVEAIDYETTGFEGYKNDVIFAFIITNEDCESRVYRFDNISERKNKVAEKVFQKFHTDTSIEKVAHNAKFEMNFTSVYFGGELPESTWHDTFIMSKLLRNLLRNHKLEMLASRYFYKMFPEDAERWEYYDKQVKQHVTKQKRLLNNYPARFQPEILDPLLLDGIRPIVTDRPNYGLVPREIMTEYQIADGERCMLLHQLMFPKIQQDKLLYKDYLNEIRLLKTSQKMEQFGMMLHEEETAGLIEFLEKEIATIEDAKLEQFGFDINLGSPDQLQKHLFGYINPKKHEVLNEPWKRIKPAFNFDPLNYTPSDSPSTAKDDLVLLREANPKEPILDMLLKYRAYNKGCAMIRGYRDLAGDNLTIHPGINTNQARTGRQSVSNPALQCVSKEVSIKVVYGIPARRCFRPRPGYVYFLGDYAGVEMRLIINACGEQYLIDKLNEDIDFDVHTYNAIGVYGDYFRGIKDKAIKKSVRADIKDAIFGLAYGANIATFAKSIRRSVTDARKLYKNYAEICPGICGFTQDKIKEVRNSGFITSSFGRKLYVESDKAYTASNYQIQGDAAGAFKRAQNKVDSYLNSVWDYDIRMLLPVHDEIIIEFPRNLLYQKEEILHDISFLMTDMPEIKVPLAIEWKMATTNWAEAYEINI